MSKNGTPYPRISIFWDLLLILGTAPPPLPRHTYKVVSQRAFTVLTQECISILVTQYWFCVLSTHIRMMMWSDVDNLPCIRNRIASVVKNGSCNSQVTYL